MKTRGFSDFLSTYSKTYTVAHGLWGSTWPGSWLTLWFGAHHTLTSCSFFSLSDCPIASWKYQTYSHLQAFAHSVPPARTLIPHTSSCSFHSSVISSERPSVTFHQMWASTRQGMLILVIVWNYLLFCLECALDVHCFWNEMPALNPSINTSYGNLGKVIASLCLNFSFVKWWLLRAPSLCVMVSIEWFNICELYSVWWL